VESWEALLPDHAWPDYTLSNHDRKRAATRYGIERARVAAMMLLTLRGTPFIYYGEEIGMTDVPIPPHRVVDVHDRDGCRTPMQWDGSRNAGFTTGEPWLPMPPDVSAANVAAQRADPRSLLSFYRRLLALRRSSGALRLGSYRTIDAPNGVFAYTREADDERIDIALNFTDAERVLVMPKGNLVLSTDDSRSAGERVEGLVLSANEGVISRRVG
jgi:alpha-glucosidase